MHETAVNFDLFEREAPQAVERRETGSKVVKGNRNTKVIQLAQGPLRALRCRASAHVSVISSCKRWGSRRAAASASTTDFIEVAISRAVPPTS